MNRNALHLLLVILLLSALPVGPSESADTTNREPPAYVISQTEMPIYEMITPEINQSYTQDMARDLFGISDTLAEEYEGVFYMTRGTETFEIDSSDGSMWYADYSKLWNVSLGIEIPTAEAAKSNADTWLSEKGILPEEASFVSVGSTNVTAKSLDDGTTRSKVLQWHVNYEFTIGDTPIAGETAQITVMIGERGDTVGFNWKWRDIKPEPYMTSSLIEYESILDVEGISPEDVVSHRLVYTTDEYTPHILYPVWEIEFLELAEEEDVTIHNAIYIDATAMDPVVQITTPASNMVYMPGTSITFDCSVGFGAPPYTFYWQSDFDGQLSTSQTFTTPTLSEVKKKNVPVPHAVSVWVWDSKNRWAVDCIKVTIETADMNPSILIAAAAAGIIAIVTGFLFVLKKRRVAAILLFLVMMLSSFMFLPVAFAGKDITGGHSITPSAPTGAYDDGKKEVGVEWVGVSAHHPLPHTQTNTKGFYDMMSNTGGYSQEFNWGEYSAWEEDFKDAQFDGTDSEWIDAVDFVYYQDHGGGDGVCFTSHHDRSTLLFIHMKLGDGDLETLVLDACSPLAEESEHGFSVFSRWNQALVGVHQICSFATTSHNSAVRGKRFAFYMTGPGPLTGMTIATSWFRATQDTEPSATLAALFYGTKSPDPLNPQLDDPINDHLEGFGYSCSDPTPGSFGWIMYITSSC
ncbi:MAG: DUF6345 domain-containing protein [Candidatus Thorarchaeota archaeon]